MAKKTPQPGLTTTLVHRIAPDLLQAMDLLRWYQALGTEPTERDDGPAKDPRGSRNAVASQALVWFAKPANHRDVTYTTLRSGWILISVTVPRSVYEPIAALADRERVQTSRVIEAAFRLYCELMVPEEMFRYHRTVSQHGTSLLRAREKIRDK
jgi:hypothetical protein